VVGPRRRLRVPQLKMDVVEAASGLAARADVAGIMLDVDGTLAPIVPRPELARVLPEVPSLLERLISRVGVVAVISGRRSDEVRALVDVPGLEVVGTHGLERIAEIDAAAMAAITEVASAAGAWVEPKGAAVAVHFRALPDPDAAAQAAAEPLTAVAAAHGLELVPGRAILELMPVGAPRKGDAVESLVEEKELEAVLFAGDDVGDLHAFTALRRLRSVGLWTCSVVAGGPEVSPAVVETADLVVDGPGGVVELLRAIAHALDAPT
jgi:trehalose 6-phosphate phosphatase